MARNVHWKVGFRTRSERLGVLSIYEEGYDGDIVELTGAAVPFETEEDADEDVLKPVRTQSGYMRVIDEDNLDGLMPTNLKDRYVEYREDDVLMWRGYMQPSTFSEPWDVKPVEVEFPLLSPLGVLESQYLDSEAEMGMMRFAAIILEILGTTGVDYSRMVVPEEFSDMEGGDVLVPLKMEVARYNFFTDADDDKTDESWYMYESDDCLSILGELMKFYGWTLYERGDVLYFVSRRAGRYLSLTYQDFVTVSYGMPVELADAEESATYGLDELETGGSDHTKSVLTGYKKITVEAGVNPVTEAVPNVTSEQVEYEGMVRYEGKGVSDAGGLSYTPKMEQTKTYDTVSRNVEFRMYEYSVDDEVWKPLYYDAKDSRDYVAAAYVEYDAFTEEDLKDKKNYNYRSAIRLTSFDQGNKFYPSYPEFLDNPVAMIRSKRVASYLNGAFVISGTIGESSVFFYEEFGLYMKLKVGGLCWNGTEWTSAESAFEVPLDIEGKKIRNTKELDMPYNGADGYVIPIERRLSGEVSLTLYPLVYGNLVFLENLEVGYFGDDNVTDNVKEGATNRYYRKTGVPFAGEKEVSVKLATTKKNKAGYGIVSLGGEPVELLWAIVGGAYRRPEEYLLDTMAGVFGKTEDKLEVELVRTDICPTDVVEWHGRRYMPVAEAMNWGDEIVRCVMMEIGNHEED